MMIELGRVTETTQDTFTGVYLDFAHTYDQD
jgi:hypothetical protein